MLELLDLQKLDLEIAERKAREQEIPRQKDKYTIHRQRLDAELAESEERCKALLVKQRECAGEIEQRQAQLQKYDGQLYSIKKNEEYKALLHEMELLKKQIAIKEERTIQLMVEYDEAREAFAADKERIQAERAKIDAECARIDAELEEVVRQRKGLESERGPKAEKVNRELLSRYERIRKVRTPAVVPLNDETCGGCYMQVRAQIVNEIMANEKIHACQHCGRLLYYLANLDGASADGMAESA